MDRASLRLPATVSVRASGPAPMKSTRLSIWTNARPSSANRTRRSEVNCSSKEKAKPVTRPRLRTWIVPPECLVSSTMTPGSYPCSQVLSQPIGLIVDDQFRGTQCYVAWGVNRKRRLSPLCSALGELSGIRVAFLGTMDELGEQSARLHREVAEYVSAACLDLIVATGAFVEAFAATSGIRPKQLVVAPTADEGFRRLCACLEGNETILFKASRSERLERYLPRLASTPRGCH